ncbi:MAG: hypothetical protein HRU20_19025 [Pseudomonadales bacterium]|nr:hypothetical protein [Pseudomonadales bacterium]
MHRFIKPLSQPFLLSVLLLISSVCVADKVGEKLTPLTFDSKPNNFHYAANGKPQLITVYPAQAASMKNASFNHKAQRLGICPLAITDIFNRGWYAPVIIVEREMRVNVEAETHKPECTLSGDYAGVAVQQWGLKVEAVTIIVDGDGIVQFLQYGVLSAEQEREAFALLQVDIASE